MYKFICIVISNENMIFVRFDLDLDGLWPIEIEKNEQNSCAFERGVMYHNGKFFEPIETQYTLLRS